MLLRRIAVAAGALALVLAPATAASAAPSEQDTTYLRAAHQSNLAEIAGGRIAQQKGASQAVKDVGARFVEDHTRLDAALRETAAALDVDLPSAPNPEQRALAARYEAASGSDFDALYLATQMDAHMKAMRLGETELARGNDAQAKKLAQDAAPVIASHHELLTDTAADLGVPTSIDTGTGGLAGRDSTGAAGLAAVGLLLVTAALVLLRRRPRATRG
jgi:putative membrane protein